MTHKPHSMENQEKMTLSTIEKSRIITQNILILIARFGWLRPKEIGIFIWPEASDSQKRAEKWARSAAKNGLILSRKLPSIAGQCLVLAERGCAEIKNITDGFIPKYYIEKSGKDYGKYIDGVWQPNMWWQHDLIIASTIAYIFKENNGDINYYTELEVRKETQGGMHKYPDFILGLKNKNNKFEYFWVEVENARKTGGAMKLLAGELITFYLDSKIKTYYSVLGKEIISSIVVYAKTALDERGYKLDHKTRICNAIEKYAKCDVTIDFMGVSLKNFTVNNIEKTTERVKSNLITQLIEDKSRFSRDDNKHFDAVDNYRLIISEFNYDLYIEAQIFDKQKEKLVFSEQYPFTMEGMVKAKRQIYEAVLNKKLINHYEKVYAGKQNVLTSQYSLDDIT